MEALRAQAVAARSYAAVERRSGYANTCDTTACQVYRGRGEYRAGTFTSFEDTRTDQAVSDTANEVRVDPTTGAPVRTEFSSSTGGQTAGGVHPAVVDDGDATPNNPHNKWTFRVPASKLENGRGLGALLAVEATKRDGLGPDGGRVQQVRLLFTKGTVTMGGGELASLLGLRSTLYTANVLVVPVHAFSDDTPTTPEEATALAADDEPGTAAASSNAASKKKTATPKSTTTTALITPAKKAPAKS
jgi:SpoIID/LytB domain protein